MEGCVSGELGNSLWWASISLFKDKYSNFLNSPSLVRILKVV